MSISKIFERKCDFERVDERAQTSVFRRFFHFFHFFIYIFNKIKNKYINKYINLILCIRKDILKGRIYGKAT